MIEELLPAPDPLETAARLQGLPHLLFLDSAARRTPTGLFSFLAADPFETIEATGRRILWRRAGGDHGEATGNVLEFARKRLGPFRREPHPELPPFQGGAAGYLGYDFGAVLERLPSHKYRDIAGPDVALGLYDWVISWDHREGRAWIFSSGIPEAGDLGDVRAPAAALSGQSLAGPAGASSVPAAGPVGRLRLSNGSAPRFPGQECALDILAGRVSGRRRPSGGLHPGW